jgi:hypothetical protein
MLKEANEKGITTWVEPFVGGANMIDKVPNNFQRIGIDYNAHTIEALIAIRDLVDKLPSEVSVEYYKSLKGTEPNPITSLISHNPYNPMSKQDYIIDINVNQTDNNFISQRLVKIVNGVETEVANSNTTALNYTTQENIYQQSLYYKQYMTYFNGQSNVELSKTYNINMQLRQSVLKIETIMDSTEPDNDGDTQYDVIPTIDYGDGAFASLRYDLYFIAPFSNVEIKVGSYIKNSINDVILNLTFTQNGRYKIFALLTDEFNGTSSDEKYIDITIDGLIVITKKPIQDIIFDRE